MQRVFINDSVTIRGMITWKQPRQEHHFDLLELIRMGDQGTSDREDAHS